MSVVVNAHPLLHLAESLVLDGTVDEREERVVVAFTNVLARVNLRPPLANEDRSSMNLLPGVSFDSEPLGIAVVGAD